VESEDQLDQAAASIHRRIGAPLVTALALAGDGLRIEAGTVAPSRLPDLFPGVPVMMSGRWGGQPGGTITVRGATADGAPFEAAVAAITGGTPASTANWARAHLRDLEDRYAGLSGYDAAELGRLERQITDVSLRYGVLCRFTAFIAVDSRVITDGGVPHRVTQPVEFPAGWDLAGRGPAFALGGSQGTRGGQGQGRLYGGPGTAGRRATRPTAPRPAGASAPSGPRPGPRPGNNPFGSTATGMGTASPGRAGSGGDRVKRDRDARLLAARDQVADEVAALRLAQDAPSAERLRFLADLATRLDALLTSLAGEPAGTGERAGLTELAVKLRACDTPGAPAGADLDALWDEAIRVLTEFSRLRAGDPGAEDRRFFWKRPR
jgi:Ca-activated chloride channel family protein